MDRTKVIMKLLHYAIGGVILLLGWVWLMDILKGDLAYTIVAWYLLYVFSDQLIHKYLLEEDYVWED